MSEDKLDVALERARRTPRRFRWWPPSFGEFVALGVMLVLYYIWKWVSLILWGAEAVSRAYTFAGVLTLIWVGCVVTLYFGLRTSRRTAR